MTAAVDWAYSTEVQSHTFGDADILPSGNIIGCAWPNTIEQNGVSAYDAFIFEATQAKTRAWELLVRSEKSAMGMEYNNVDEEAPNGWAFYSVERFYETPIVANVEYFPETYVLKFDAWNTHRTATTTTGVFKVYCENSGSLILDGELEFEEFWYTTSVVTTFHPAADCPGQSHVLQLSNSWGATTEVKFNSLYLYNLNTTGTGITSSTTRKRNHQREAKEAYPQAENSLHPWTESPAH